jgi:hypothetical protein
MKLQELLAKIGMPLQQSRQSYQYITPVLRNHLKSQLENETIQNDYNLVQPGIIFRSNSYYYHHHHLSSSIIIIICVVIIIIYPRHQSSYLIYNLAFHHFLSAIIYLYRTFIILPLISACMQLSSIMHLSSMHLSYMHLNYHLCVFICIYHLSCLYRSFCRYHGFKNPISATDLVQAVLALTGR